MEEKKDIFYCIGTEREFNNLYPVLEKELPKEVLGYVALQVQILDNSYGAHRDIQGDMGGMCIVFPKLNQESEEAYCQILKQYHIQESMFEYRDVVSINGTEWEETLYLVHNDYGLVVVCQNGTRTGAGKGDVD